MNAAYIDKSFEGTRYTTDKGNSKGYIYNTADPNATLAHELGHYLGLFHAFSEKTGDESNSDEANNDEDTDHCTDTPSYNRVAYTKWLTDYIKNAKDEAKADGRQDTTFSMKILAKRDNSRKEEWQSDNLMDYSVGYSMRFTPEQVHRMRQVLYYSPLIPGPKKVRPTTRALSELPTEEGELPIVLAK